MALLIFFLILSILILIHEFGHFIVAKKNGIRVEEFGLGLPPRMIGKKLGETIYSLNWLPFGGFVRLTGEDLEDAAEEDSLSDPRSFASKTALQRLAVLLAGVFMNFVLAIVLFYALLIARDFKSFYVPLLFDYQFKFGNVHKISTVVSGFGEEAPAERAGVQLGEAIIKINGVAVNNVDDVRRELSGTLGQPVELEVIDLKVSSEQKPRFLVAEPYPDESGNAVLGVYLTTAAYLSYDTPVERALSGFLHGYNVFTYSASTMADIVVASFRARDIAPVSQTVAGPVGIYNIVGSILDYAGADAFLSLVDYTALMSLSLAFINMLPFPALDGGRAVFILVEVITRRKLNPKLEARIHRAGMLVLLALLALVTIKDIR